MSLRWVPKAQNVEFLENDLKSDYISVAYAESGPK
jgi:hypothetical protein